jgi:hypothetical protein
MGALAQALEISLEVQRKRSNENIARKKKKKLSKLQDVFLFFSLDLSYFQSF